ncbi:MAG: hypothetical protein M3O85_05170 [Acidobacteriota bacterium]|nr:hypothetical protein [Acidobacteriota bacterium]
MNWVALLLACLALAPGAQATGPKRLPDFPDYPVKEVFKGKPARPRIVTPYQKRFRTVIRQSMQEGVNFAGHYTVVIWGCGTSCAQFAVTDVISGRVYDPPLVSVALHLGPDDDHQPQKYLDIVNVKPGSALLVVEGCPNEGDKCGRFYFHFHKGRFTLLHFDPDPPDQPAK